MCTSERNSCIQPTGMRPRVDVERSRLERLGFIARCRQAPVAGPFLLAVPACHRHQGQGFERAPASAKAGAGEWHTPTLRTALALGRVPGRQLQAQAQQASRLNPGSQTQAQVRRQWPQLQVAAQALEQLPVVASIDPRALQCTQPWPQVQLTAPRLQLLAHRRQDRFESGCPGHARRVAPDLVVILIHQGIDLGQALVHGLNVFCQALQSWAQGLIA